MTTIAQTTCNQCPKVKGETNHWIVATYTDDPADGIRFSPAEAMRNQDILSLCSPQHREDLCGEGCAHTALSQFFTRLRKTQQPALPVPEPDTVQQPSTEIETVTVTEKEEHATDTFAS